MSKIFIIDDCKELGYPNYVLSVRRKIVKEVEGICTQIYDLPAATPREFRRIVLGPGIF